MTEHQLQEPPEGQHGSPALLERRLDDDIAWAPQNSLYPRAIEEPLASAPVQFKAWFKLFSLSGLAYLVTEAALNLTSFLVQMTAGGPGGGNALDSLVSALLFPLLCLPPFLMAALGSYAALRAPASRACTVSVVTSLGTATGTTLFLLSLYPPDVFFQPGSWNLLITLAIWTLPSIPFGFAFHRVRSDMAKRGHPWTAALDDTDSHAYPIQEALQGEAQKGLSNSDPPGVIKPKRSPREALPLFAWTMLSLLLGQFCFVYMESARSYMLLGWPNGLGAEAILILPLRLLLLPLIHFPAYLAAALGSATALAWPQRTKIIAPVTGVLCFVILMAFSQGWPQWPAVLAYSLSAAALPSLLMAWVLNHQASRISRRERSSARKEKR